MNHADRRYFNPDTAAGSHPATGFIRRALRWMLALLVTLFALTVIAQFLLASHLNRQSDTHDGIIVSRVITHAATDLQRQLHDYANWGDAWRHLHLALDVDWAWRDNNLAGTLYRDFGINGVFVLAPDGSTRYAVINGELSQHSLESWLGAPLSAVRRPVGEPPLIGVAGQPALLASAPITPGGDSRLGPGAGPWSQLIFVQLLTPTALQQLGEAYGITGLRVLPEREQPHHRLALPPWRFSWQADEPGRSLLLTMLPLTLLLGSLVAFGAGWLYRRALGKARLMDENSFLLAQSREALAASERRFRDVAEASTDWIWELDNQLNFTWISQRFPNLTGYSITQWQGRPITDLLQTEGEPLADWIRQPGERGHRRLLYCHYLSAQGHRRYCHLVMKPIYSRSGIEGYRGTATDVTLEVEAQARLQYMSRHDALTGLPNRKRMQEFLAGRLQAHATLDNPLAMIGVDLDQFKAINDRYGHQIGDRVLNVVSQRLSNCLQDTDLVTRQGGDEFTVIVAEHATTPLIAELCARLLGETGRPIRIDGHDIVVSASMGIARAPQDACDASELLRLSDIALYRAKNAGRNRWVFYRPEMAEQIVQRREMERSLREALKQQQFQLVWQPRFHLKSRQIVAAEALIRWQHPSLGTIMPDQFIPLAEETGLIDHISQWVLHTACAEALAWPQPLAFSVNISAQEFHTDGLLDRVKAAISATGMDPLRLELEVTESAALWSPPESQALMYQLKALGIRLLVDDFGTGYSSLNYLRTFPFDGIKLDRSFITGLPDTGNASLIVENIIGLGKAFSLSVTAEGVETHAQLDKLTALRCDEAQGYLIAKPMSQARFIRQLSEAPSGEPAWQYPL